MFAQFGGGFTQSGVAFRSSILDNIIKFSAFIAFSTLSRRVYQLREGFGCRVKLFYFAEIMMMKRLVFVMMVAVMLVASDGEAVMIDIQNPSFELQAGDVGGGGTIIGETDGEWLTTATGWYGGSGVLNPAPDAITPETTDGVMTSWTAAGGYLAQPLVYEGGSPVLVEDNQTFIFTFDLGFRTDAGAPPTDILVQMWADGIWIVNAWMDVSDQVQGEWITRELTVGWTDNQVQLGVQADVALYNTAGQILTDSWSAIVVPEPATLTLLGFGAMAFIRRRKV